MDLKKIQEDLVELRRIEMLIKPSKLIGKDVLSLNKLAGRGIPLAEYLFGLYALYCLKDHVLAHQWFHKCKRHANGYFLWKLALAYDIMGINWTSELIDCIKRWAWNK
jgi:hypothetical protein